MGSIPLVPDQPPVRDKGGLHDLLSLGELRVGTFCSIERDPDYTDGTIAHIDEANLRRRVFAEISVSDHGLRGDGANLVGLRLCGRRQQHQHE